jgi:hypothetical protein
MEQFTDTQLKTYKEDTAVCPNCGGKDLRSGSFNYTGNGGYVKTGCEKCGFEWDDTYTLTGAGERSFNEIEQNKLIFIRMEGGVPQSAFVPEGSVLKIWDNDYLDGHINKCPNCGYGDDKELDEHVVLKDLDNCPNCNVSFDANDKDLHAWLSLPENLEEENLFEENNNG